jgi:arginase family enzyme
MVVSPDMIGNLTNSEKENAYVLEEIIDRQLLNGHREEELESEKGIAVGLRDRESGKGRDFSVEDKVIYYLVRKYEEKGFKVNIEKFNQPAKYTLYFHKKE